MERSSLVSELAHAIYVRLTSDIAHQEYCCTADRSGTTDVRAVGYIMMELMQKYAKDGGAIGIENLHRWSVDSDAVKFLSMTTSASSVEELMKVSALAMVNCN